VAKRGRPERERQGLKGWADLLNQLTHSVAGFFRWWVGELKSLVPAPLRHTFRRDLDILLLEFAGDSLVLRRCRGRKAHDLGAVDLTALDRADSRKAVRRALRRVDLKTVQVGVRLPEGQALRKSVELPAAAAENLRQVVSFEMNRLTPFEADDVYFDCRITRQEAGAQQIAADLVVAPKSAVEAALARAGDLGLQPSVVDVAGDGEGVGVDFNLISDRLGSTSARTGAGLTAALGLLAAALCAAMIYIPLDRQRDLADELSREGAQARVEAQFVSRLRAEIDAASQAKDFIVEKKLRNPTATQALNELTRLLPDDTWLFQLRLNGEQASLYGFSASAAALVGALEAGALFHDVGFRSPVTRDLKSNLERFHLSLEVRAGAEP
jgi:general secretion pathway protein L